MDKYDLILDLAEHPDKYTPEQADEILSDPAAREIYNLLCKTESAMQASSDSPDVDAEWERFVRRADNRRRNPFFPWFGNRAASIAALAVTSIAALAIGVAVTVNMTDHKTDPIAANENKETLMKVSAQTESSEAIADTIAAPTAPIVFEDEALRDIMAAVARLYGVTVNYESGKTSELHLYFRLDPSLPLDEVVEQLNTFEQINIIRNDNTLTVK